MRKNTGLRSGDLRKISEMTGYSYPYVRNVLVDKTRKNSMIVEAANFATSFFCVYNAFLWDYGAEICKNRIWFKH